MSQGLTNPSGQIVRPHPGTRGNGSGLARWASAENRERVLEISLHQYGLLARRQLLAIGFTERQVEWASTRRLLLPVCNGVYALGRPIETQRAFFMAGVLAAGPDGVLARNSAARLWGFSDRGDQVDVIRPESRKPRAARITPPGTDLMRPLLVRRTRYLPPDHITVVHGIPVTTVERTLMEIAGDVSPRILAYRFLEADRLGLIDDQRLGQILIDGRGHKGIAHLRRIAGERNPDVQRTRSLLEALLQKCAVRLGLPRPETNVPVCGYTPDFYWRALALVIEVDGREFHSGRMRMTRDVERDNTFRKAGLDVLRFTWREVAGPLADETASLIERTAHERITRFRSTVSPVFHSAT